MISFISNLFGSKKPKDYSQQKEELRSADVKARINLAADTSANKEMLYYLAENDPNPKVRRAVAQNKFMPVQVSPILAADSDQDVRLALAARLIDLLPDLSCDEQSQLYAFAVQALGTLALDEVLKIRIALSSTLKSHAHAPPKVAGQLARDVEREVSEPILRFCAALSDEDLLDILTTHPESWVVKAIAGRSEVSEGVSEAVIETQDRPGGAVLLENEGANITESLLHYIVEKSRSFTEWQKPMALRKSLPVSIAKDLAEFVDASVRDLLISRGDFDETDTEEIASVFRRRMDFAQILKSGEGKDLQKGDEGSDFSGLQERLKKLITEEALTEDVISDAIAMRDTEFVVMAIAHLAKASLTVVRKIFDMHAPKPIVALCWKAGLSMRMALQLQKEMGHVSHKELVYPKDGTDYPLTDEDLNWQLEFLGLKAA